MKNMLSSESDTSRHSMSVLSTYVYFLTSHSNEQNDVAILSMPPIIPKLPDNQHRAGRRYLQSEVADAVS